MNALSPADRVQRRKQWLFTGALRAATGTADSRCVAAVESAGSEAGA